jgi:hypothetical protein
MRAQAQDTYGSLKTHVSTSNTLYAVITSRTRARHKAIRYVWYVSDLEVKVKTCRCSIPSDDPPSAGAVCKNLFTV